MCYVVQRSRSNQVPSDEDDTFGFDVAVAVVWTTKSALTIYKSDWNFFNLE